MTLARALFLLGSAAAVACTRSTELVESAVPCAAPGPAIMLGVGDEARTAFALAADIGRHALCTCTSLTLSGALSVTPLFRHGIPPPGEEPRAGVGCDGDVSAEGPVFVEGSLEAAGAGGIDLGRGGHVAGDVRSGGPLVTAMPASVTGEAFAASDVFGQLTIEGPLHLPAGAVVGPGVIASAIVREPVSVSPPCDCQPGPLFDSTATVEARVADNDSGTLSFAIEDLASLDASRTVDVPCGEYYVDEIRSTAADLELRVSGRAGIFVGGDVHVDGNLSVTLEPGAELDLVIAGSLFSTGRVLGAAGAAHHVRIWIGSTTVALPDQIQVGALIYAPSAVLTAGAGLQTTGVLFVGTLSVDGDVRLTAAPVFQPGDGAERFPSGAAVAVGSHERGGPGRQPARPR